MITRIKALRSVFGLALTCFELILAISFLAKAIGEGSIFDDVFSSAGELNYRISNLNFDKSVESSAKFLAIILTFMIFALVMITVIPRIIERAEEEPEEDWDENVA